jgi:hypothetical protein
LKPHYQLEGLSVSLRLVSKLPSEKGWVFVKKTILYSKEYTNINK